MNIELKPLPSKLLLTLDSSRYKSDIDKTWWEKMESTFSIMGRIQSSGEDEFGIYLNGKLKEQNQEFKKTEFNLEHGNYDFRIKHNSGKYEDYNEPLVIVPGMTKDLRVKLKPSQEFVKHNQWQSKMDKLIIASVGSFLLSASYFQLFNKAKVRKYKNEDLINDKSDPDMQDHYYQQTVLEISKMKTNSARVLAFSLIGLGFSGWTYWTWTEQPERPAPIKFNISSLPNNKLQMSLSYNF